ncbi:hypothetical protein [Bosea thiooxidans]
MTTIGSTPYFTAASRPASVARPASGGGFADQTASEATASSKAPSDKLTDLLSQLEQLRNRQLQMSNSEYLSAKLSLQEQISTERLNAGEDLDVIGMRFEGQVYQLAGKKLDLASLKIAGPSQIAMVQPAAIGDIQGSAKLRGHQAQTQTGFDIKA